MNTAFSYDTKLLLEELHQALYSVPLNRALILDLIRRGADPNFQKAPGDHSFFSEQLLDWEDTPISPEAVALLLEAGADPNHDAGDGVRPLSNACIAHRPDVVALLLRHGADPNFIIDERESLLDDVNIDHWIKKDDIGTAWEQEHTHGDVEKLRQIVELLISAGAKSIQDMVAAKLTAWVHLWPGSPGKLLTRAGYIAPEKIPILTVAWKTKWLDWCGRNFNPGRNQSILDTPTGFNRRAYNREGIALARDLKTLIGGAVRVDLFLLDPDNEEAFVSNCYQVRDVGGVEKHPSLAHPFSAYAQNPGFHLKTKAVVALDLSDIEIVGEFFVRGERYHPELKLNFGELERSIEGDGRYAIFHHEQEKIMVEVLWGADSVLWRVALPAGNEELAFLREKYAEAIQDTKEWAGHTARHARIAVDQFKHRVPTLTNTGQIQSSVEAPTPTHPPSATASYLPTGPEAELAARSRIWEGCVFFAAAINRRDPEALAGRMTENACLTGDRRPALDGRPVVLDYLRLAFDDLRQRTDANRVWAEIGHLWLTGEPCVLLWEAGQAVALVNVCSNPERQFTSCHFMTEPQWVGSVERTRIFPGRPTAAS